MCACVLPIQWLGLIEGHAILVQHCSVGLQYNNIVGHHSSQHDHHLHLVIDPQEHRTGDEAQDTAVDEVLKEQRGLIKFYF